MGHLVGKDLYRKLGKKIDGLVSKAPWNDTLYHILKELYTTDEAEVAVKMPYGLASFDQIMKATGFEEARLKNILDGLCRKGLVMDLWYGGRYRYMLSPMVIGIFEFTLMRTAENLNYKEWARLFESYFSDGSFYKANLSKGQQVSPLRVLPYEETIDDLEHVEILDYEKASAIIHEAKKFSVGLCSCRHEKVHTGKKKCDIPLDTCSTIGMSAKYMVSHGFAKEVTKSKMLEDLARSKELGLVICADNVKKDISFFCHCCGCCCNVLLGINKFGYPNSVVTSSYIVKRDIDACTECGQCAEVCSAGAIKANNTGSPDIDETFCIGCGVCASKCAIGAIKLVKRKQKVLHPEDTFERVILQSLERDNLQNLLFADMNRIDHKFMRVMVGSFLRLPPIKKALMSEKLKSSFLDFMRKGA